MLAWLAGITPDGIMSDHWPHSDDHPTNWYDVAQHPFAKVIFVLWSGTDVHNLSTDKFMRISTACLGSRPPIGCREGGPQNRRFCSVITYACKRFVTSVSRASDSGLNFPVRSISTLNVTGTLLVLQERT
jgi:hypothetical protein